MSETCVRFRLGSRKESEWVDLNGHTALCFGQYVKVGFMKNRSPWTRRGSFFCQTINDESHCIFVLTSACHGTHRKDLSRVLESVPPFILSHRDIFGGAWITVGGTHRGLLICVCWPWLDRCYISCVTQSHQTTGMTPHGSSGRSFWASLHLQSSHLLFALGFKFTFLFEKVLCLKIWNLGHLKW